MNRRRLRGVFLASIGPALIAAAWLAAPAPPIEAAGPAGSALPAVSVDCASCHDQPAAWKAKPNVHPPVQGGDCLSCHNAHASRHGSLLRLSPMKTCLGCHGDLGETIRAGRPHGALDSEKQCLACHDPHASDRKQLLVGATSSMCASCHEPEMKAAARAKVHAPFSLGDCLACHDPHVSERPWLATRAEPALCTGCHKLPDPELTAAHKNISVAEAQCTSCHAPHAAGAAGLIRPTAHAPFAEGSCDTCHADPKEAAASLRGRALDLCSSCHDPWKTGHPVPPQQACLACHDSHASPGAALIAGRERDVCLTCHTDTAAQRAASASMHPPTGASGDCTTCHLLHTGDGAGLLKKAGAQQTCGQCHASHAEFSHPMGEGVADPSHPGQFLGCLSCHDPHGSPFPVFLLADPRQELCLRCHERDGH